MDTIRSLQGDLARFTRKVGVQPDPDLVRLLTKIAKILEFHESRMAEIEKETIQKISPPPA